MFWIRLPSKAVILKPKDPGDCSTCGICSRPMKFRHASPDSTLLCQNEANVNGRTCSSTGGDISSVMRRNELSSVRPDFTIHLKRSQPPAAASYISGNVKSKSIKFYLLQLASISPNIWGHSLILVPGISSNQYCSSS